MSVCIISGVLKRRNQPACQYPVLKRWAGGVRASLKELSCGCAATALLLYRNFMYKNNWAAALKAP